MKTAAVLLLAALVALASGCAVVTIHVHGPLRCGRPERTNETTRPLLMLRLLRPPVTNEIGTARFDKPPGLPGRQ